MDAARCSRVKKSAAPLLGSLAAAVALTVSGCDWMPGKPTPAERWVEPEKVLDFHRLFTTNCLGCHSDGKVISPAISMADPVYLALVPENTLRSIIVNGVPKTPMPAFAKENGGMLTDEQIDVIVKGIREWAKDPPPAPLPAYSAAPGNAEAGETLYAIYKEAIRKSAGEGVVSHGFLTNPAFLGLCSDQYLRTILITGRPELGIPDWRNAIPGRPLSDQDIADLVAFLISQRKNEFGQPLVPAPPQPDTDPL